MPAARPHLHRTDPARNMARFYALSVEATLFGPALVSRWGRIGTRGQKRCELHADVEAAEAALGQRLGQKLRRGYRVIEG